MLNTTDPHSQEKDLIIKYVQYHGYTTTPDNISLCSGSKSVYQVTIKKSAFGNVSSFHQMSTSTATFNFFNNSPTNSPSKLGINEQEKIAIKFVKVDVDNEKAIEQYNKALLFSHKHVLKTLPHFQTRTVEKLNDTLNCQEKFYIFPLEYIPKGTLTNICGKVKEPLVWKVISQLTSALSYIYYGDGLVHRGVTTDNILVRSVNVLEGDIDVVLFHFNLMRHLYTRNTVNHEDVTTEAPEVSQGKYTAFSDIYSLGMTIYKLCLGARLPPKETLDHCLSQKGFSKQLAFLLNHMTAVNTSSRMTYVDIILYCKLFFKTRGISLNPEQSKCSRGKEMILGFKNDSIECEKTDPVSNISVTEPFSSVTEGLVVPGQPVIAMCEIVFPEHLQKEYLSIHRGDCLVVHEIQNGWLICQNFKTLHVGKVYYDLVSLMNVTEFKKLCHPIQ